MWRLKEVRNISEHTIPIPMEGGKVVYLPPKGVLVDIRCPDIRDFERFTKITHDLTEVGQKRRS